MSEATEKVVLYEKQGSVAIITLNRTKMGNCISRELAVLLIESFARADSDAEVRSVVFTANGKSFCTGGDVPYLDTLTNPFLQYGEIHNTGKVIKLMTGMEKPIVGAVPGYAVGAGFGFVLACDLIVCSTATRFMSAFSNVGLASDCGTAYLLTKAVGRHKAKELLLLSEMIEPQALLELGVVSRITAEEALLETALAMAGKLAERASMANALIKSLVNNSDVMSLEASLAYEETIQTVCMNTEDFHEGARAFAEKRRPVFTGK